MNRTAPGPVPSGLLGADHLGMQRQSQVGVGVHPDESPLPLAFQQISGPPVPLGSDYLSDNQFPTLGRPLFLQACDMAVERKGQSVQRHAGPVIANSLRRV